MSRLPPEFVPGVAEAVVLRDHVGDHGVARVALADVDAGVGAPRGVDVVELALGGVEGVDAVVAVAEGGEVRAAVAVDAGPEEPVGGVVAGRHVLDGDAVGQHPDAVLELELAVEDHRVAVEASDGEVLGLDVDGLVVDAGRDEDEIARLRGVDRRLDRRLVVGHADGALGPRRLRARWCRRRRRSSPLQADGARRRAASAAMTRRVVRCTGSPLEAGDHPVTTIGADHALGGRAVERAVVGVGAGLGEAVPVGGAGARSLGLGAPVVALDGQHVVGVAAGVGPHDLGAGGHLDLAGTERVVDRVDRLR